MILNEQLIQDMFLEQNSKELISLPREDISLNFTASNRSTKNQKKSPSAQQKQQPKYESTDIIDMAAQELSKFSQWVTETETNYSLNLDCFNTLIEEIEMGTYQISTHDDLIVIKEELFRREQEDLKIDNCQQCSAKNKQIQELQQLNEDQDEILTEKEREITDLKQTSLLEGVEEAKQYLLAEVQNNILKSEIKILNTQINALKSQKITLERTFLFNKTRNSQINLLQKSKDLSAAKNSTNSSEILNRNHQTIVFIDPIQSDVEQWIKFFETQKNRYRLLCKKQGDEKQKELGRLFNKQQKDNFDSEDKVCILFNSIKEILRNLIKIRENTSSFEQTQSMGKSALRDKMLKSNDQEAAPLKEEYEKLSIKFSKLVKINEYLVREKQNLEEINLSLKQQRLWQNNERNYLSEIVKQESMKVSELCSKIKQYENSVKQLNHELLEKEEQLLYAFEEIKKMKKTSNNSQTNDKNWSQLQNMYKSLQKKKKELEIENKSYLFKLKKEAMQRKKYYNQIEDMKGSFRIFCKIRENSSNIIQTYNLNETFHPSIFHKVITPDPNAQEKLYDDIRKLIVSAFDNFHFTIFNYGHAESGKANFIYGDEQNQSVALRILKEIFKFTEIEKEIKVQVSLNIFELANDKLIDLIDSERSSKLLEQSLATVQLPQYVVDSAEVMEEMYFDALQNKKMKEKYESSKTHLIIRANLEIFNLKTGQKYKSRVNLVDLASDPMTKEYTTINKSLVALSKCLVAFSSKEKIIPCRENKLTQLLKDSFSSNNKIFMIVNVSSTMTREQIKQTLTFAQSSKIPQKARKIEENDEISKARRSISRKNI